MRIALAQINPTVGDLSGNHRRIAEFIVRARDRGAEAVVLPELAMIGYPPRDLLLKPRFIEANVAAVRELAGVCRGITALVGFAEPHDAGAGPHLHNAVAVLRDGQVQTTCAKTLLPTYDVFDESRYFEPNDTDTMIELSGRRVGISICEDLWNDRRFISNPHYHRDPIGHLAAEGAELFLNASASPFETGKHGLRERLFGAQASRHGLPLVFVNQVGGNDELIFDGASGVFDAGGRVVARAKAFEEDLLIVDPFAPGEPPADYPDDLDALRRALVLGMRDYVAKCGFRDVVLGLSGGIDSSLVAALAVEALGGGHVHGVAMPSRYSSAHSLDDAAGLAEALGIDYRVIGIETAYAAMLETMAPHFAGREPDVAEENLQARLRGMILMGLSNKLGWLVLATGNKSEMAVGYCTLYGDMAGGLAAIGDVPKTTVYALGRHVNEQAGRDVIPPGVFSKPPSAELRPDQTDQDSLPPYDQLDKILRRYVEESRTADQIVADGFDAATVRRVVRLVDTNEYKRKQAAPVLKVTGRAFGIGRRMPIAARIQ